jgi:hypothetical protein
MGEVTTHRGDRRERARDRGLCRRYLAPVARDAGQDRQGPRPDDSAVAPAAGGSGDRVRLRGRRSRRTISCLKKRRSGSATRWP